jgi:hypothetical protein
MAEPKTRPTGQSVKKFLDGIRDKTRREDCYTVLRLMKRATKAEPRMWGPSIVGFGEYRLQYASGRELDWPLTGFSPRKQALTLYLLDCEGRHSALLRKLGKHKTSKACLYIQRLADVDSKVLAELINQSVRDARRTHC